MKTALCDMLRIDYPIIAAPMGPDLVAAVSNAGGLGILQAQFCTPPVFRQEIRRVRAGRFRRTPECAYVSAVEVARCP